MGKKVSIPYYLQAAAGDSGEILIWEVEPAKKFKTSSVYISFPPGTYYELEVAVLRGIKQVAPYTGTYRGDAQVIEDEFIEDISSGERVVLLYKNNNATQIRECFVIVRGELED